MSRGLMHQGAEMQPVGEEYRLIEYVPNAEFKYWLRRVLNAMILCLVSCVVLMLVCQHVQQLQVALFAFFRWVLQPVKPLLIASPSAELSGLVAFLTPISHFFNLLMLPVVVWLTALATESPSYLRLADGKLQLLRLTTFQTARGAAVRGYVAIKRLPYLVVKIIPINDNTQISVERPQGKKSTLDYVLNFNNSGLNLRLRWGDIIKANERQRLLEELEQAVPNQIDSAMFAPFKRIPQRQSYTELWLRELSGAPKRERLTPLSEGSQLRNGDYTILRKVGVGGQGTVYLASPAKTKGGEADLVVVKEFVLPVYPDIRVRKKAAERFQAEAMMLSRLEHPQIVKFLDLLVEDHRAYLVLEHVEGTTLKEMVANEGPMREPQVLDIARQIAGILVYLHSQEPPVTHRDLTPDNIILGVDGLAKLIDFSVAQEISQGVTGSVVGKPNYIAPEQFRGKPNTQSDIYSLGATIYYLLAGREPPPITILHPQAENESVSAALDRIVARCTQLEASHRYADAQSVLADLEAVSL